MSATICPPWKRWWAVVAYVLTKVAGMKIRWSTATVMAAMLPCIKVLVLFRCSTLCSTILCQFIRSATTKTYNIQNAFANDPVSSSKPVKANIGISADKLRMPRFARNWLKSAECVLVRVFLHKFRYQASLGAPDTSVEFQRVNSRICVAMMVFAPIYVVQMISSYLQDPGNKTGAFGWVKSWKRQITKNTTRKPRKWQWRPLANEERIKLTH